MNRIVVAVACLGIFACSQPSPLDPTPGDPAPIDSDSPQHVDPPRSTTSGEYEVIDLGSLGGFESSANDIDNAGTVVGWTKREAESSQKVPFRWLNGTMQSLAGWDRGMAYIVRGDIIAGVPGMVWRNGNANRVSENFVEYFNVYEINSRGEVLATGSFDYHVQQAALLTPFAEIDLGHLGDRPYTYPTAMNEAGTIVGYSDPQLDGAHGDAGTMFAPFMWTDGEMTALPVLAEYPCPPSDGPFPEGICKFGFAQDINEEGVIVGFSANAELRVRPVIWRNGVLTEMDALPGRRAFAKKINNREQIILTTESPDRVYIWENGVTTDLGTLGGEWAQVTEFTDDGIAVGQSANAHGESRAFVWRNGRMTELGMGARGGTQSGATGINDRGEIVGWTKGHIVGSQATRAILWRPL